MCNPIALAIMGAGKSALEIQSLNRSLEAQAESVNNQLLTNYMEQAYETRANALAAVDQGFIADVNRKQAVGAAKVKGAALGIRGITGRERVAEENRVGYFNMATAKENRRNADAAYTIGTSASYSNADAQIKSIEAQAATPFESLVNIAAGGFSGYMTGLQVQDMLADPTGVI